MSDSLLLELGDTCPSRSGVTAVRERRLSTSWGMWMERKQ